MPIPSTSTWEIEHWKFKNRDEVRALTDDQLLSEWRELTRDIQIFFRRRVTMTMEMSWLFTAIVAIAEERRLSLNA